MKILLSYIICISILTACSSPRGSIYTDDNTTITSTDALLNYDDTTLSLKQIIEKTHFEIRITIDSIAKPYIIKTFSLKKIIPVYTISNISGTTIFHAHVSKNGKIYKTGIVKSAGLGLDKVAEKILRKLRLQPVYSQGKKYKSKIFIRISIKGTEQL